MNSISSHSNNVNTTLLDAKKCASQGLLLFTDASAQEKPFFETQKVIKEGLSFASNSVLGSITKSCNPTDDEKKINREKKFNKQELAMNLIGGRLEQCGRVPVPVNYNNKLIHIPYDLRSINILKNGESFSFGGLMRCGSVWNCPVCASIITEFRRQELKEAHESALAQGLFVSMLTLTVPHYSKDRLNEVLGDEKTGIQGALRKMKQMNRFKKLMNEIGLVGNIRALEVTYGKNGWHPHFHILLFTKKSLADDELKILSEVLLSQWQAACVSSGLPCPNEHGLDLVNGAWAAAYMTKWGIEEEMTKGHLKNGVKEGHVSPFGLLDLYDAGDENAGKKFQEFAASFKGKRQLVWSKGLRELLKVSQQKSDPEVIDEVESKSEVFAKISYEDFKKILIHRKQAECLFVCSQGIEALNAWLSNLHHLDLSFPHHL